MKKPYKPTCSEEALAYLTTCEGLEVALVGNAMPPAGYCKGSEIDSHDIVIRFNSFSDDDKYTNMVGCRTSYWCLNGRDYSKAYKDCDVLLPRLLEHLQNHPDTVISFDHGCSTKVALKPRYSRWGYDISKHPSTGLRTICVLNSLQIPHRIYNFDFLRTPHYWDTRFSNKKWHSPDKEEAFIKNAAFTEIADKV